MTQRTKQYGPFVPIIAGNELVQKCFQFTETQTEYRFSIRASADDPVLLRITPWVVAAFVGANLLVGTAASDDAYIEVGDVDETTPGVSTAKVFRITENTSIICSLGFTANAVGVLTLTGNAVADETVTIGDVTYTWKAVPALANEVDIGSSASGSIDNLIAAITAGAGVGTVYGTGTVKNPKASAAPGSVNSMDVTSTGMRSTANAVATTETMANASFGGATLSGATTAGQIDLFIEG